MAAPKLRFKEFDGDWEETSLSKLMSYFKGYAFKSKSYQESGIRIVRVSDLGRDKIKNHTNAIYLDKSEEETYKKWAIKTSDIIITTVGSKPHLIDSAVGRPIFIRNDKEGLLNQNLLILRPIDKHTDAYFIYSQLTDRKYLNHIENIQRGNANQSNITVKDLLKFNILKTKEKEQTKIATFLSAVDTKIDELIQKHELLTDYKKGMMQQLFSQKLRFKADDGSDFEDWEETNLGEVCSHFKSGKSITSRNISTTGKFAVYGGNGLRGYTDSFTHEGKFILVGRQGALCGNVNVVDGNNYISEHAIAIQANKNNSTDWLAYWLDKMKLNRFSESSAQAGLAVNKLVKFKIELPSLPEQTKIANFLTAIDQKIDNVAEQIDHAKTWKKGLLQQMFV
ncbi:restriction endonuclease subunit S [Psychrobacter celer]|uniref:restriction endonuclease subunit S n=1 Tax=Psychrobacter celer TaxID=306572 RepID=UPI003FCF6105